ncbi:MAG: CapA family protein [Chloroflexi bacterium]|nr:CapA family protein [Chloroflexota bacterium]
MLYDAQRGDISIALGGDAMITRRMRPFKEDRFLQLVDILRNADATILNLEMLFHDYEDSWMFSGGTPTRSDPRNIEELKWMGVDAVTTANNHAFDFSEGGFLTTLRHCNEFGLPQAGGGKNMDEARAPAFVDTAKGRVAVLGATSSYSEQSRAGMGRPDFVGKPGVNGVRHNVAHTVTHPVFDALKLANKELGYEDLQAASRAFGFSGNVRAPNPATEVQFINTRFTVGEEFSRKTACNKEDLDGISKWIRDAKQQADWVVYGFHSHESGPTGEMHGGGRTSPPEFLVEFAHWSIDQGCDVFVGHGPHFLKGIEIYKGKPIFYSLGHLIIQNETVPWVPSEGYNNFGLGYEHTPGDFQVARTDHDRRGFPADPAYWRTIVPIVNFEGRKLKDIRIYPIELGYKLPVPQRGRPLLASREHGQETLEWLQQLCQPYGTRISIEHGTGLIMG